MHSMMDRKYYSTGTYDFKAMVSGCYFFVDKTLMIRDLCCLRNTTLLYTRPRRFGKTTNLSMIDYFFNMRYADGEDIFRGLKIDGCPQCRQHRNAYPVVRMNFGRLDSTDPAMFRRSMAMMLSDAVDPFLHLTEAGIDGSDAEFIRRCFESNMDDSEMDGSVGRLCRILASFHGKDVIILVDEYDACIQTLRSRDSIDRIAGLLRPFLEQTFKHNDHLHLGIVAGIMPLARTGTLSSFGSVSVRSILDAEDAEYFGFTEHEVEDLLACTGNTPEKMTEIRELYDGYSFGGVDVYNPYTVMMYLENHCRLLSYWNNMTGGSLSEDLVAGMGTEALITLKNLYQNPGSTIRTPIDMGVVYADAISAPADPSVTYSFLAMAGYLNATYIRNMDDGIPECDVSIVNREVSFAFKSLLERATYAGRVAVSAMDAVYSCNPALLGRYLTEMLEGISMDRTWSQDEDPTLRHNKYRDIIMAYLVTPDSVAREELPKGYGRTDIFFERSGDNPPVVMEIKTTVDRTRDLGSLAEEALGQIDLKGYADEPGAQDAIRVGVAVRQKTAEVRISR